MRRIGSLLLAWCWLAAAMAAMAGEQSAPTTDNVPLLRGATPTDAPSNAAATVAHAKTHPVPAKGPVSVKVRRAGESEATPARVVYERVDTGDEPVDIEGPVLNAPPRDTREAVSVDFLRRDRSNFAEPVSGEALRDGAFGEMGRTAYRLPEVDGAALRSAVQSVRPVQHLRTRTKLPVTEISWAGIVLVGLLLVRHLLRSWRSNHRQTGVA